jgi:hypothetical protein
MTTRPFLLADAGTVTVVVVVVVVGGSGVYHQRVGGEG